AGKSLGGRSGQGGHKASELECEHLRQQIKTLTDKIDKLEAELAKLQGEDQQEKKPEEPTTQTATAPMADELAVWGHDITIQPGKTYRYRFTVEVYNPLFAHKVALIDSQKPLAEKFTLASQTSEWS